MEKIREKISIKGVVIGAIADIGGTNVWAFFLTLYLIFSYHLLSIPPNELANEISSIIRGDPLIFSLNLLMGSLFSILGGYVPAHIAKRNELLNGALSSFLCVLLGLYSIVSGTAFDSLWLHLVSLVLSPALALLGGFLKLKQRSRSLLPGKLLQTE
jgi:hypothetical protein